MVIVKTFVMKKEFESKMDVHSKNLLNAVFFCTKNATLWRIITTIDLSLFTSLRYGKYMKRI